MDPVRSGDVFWLDADPSRGSVAHPHVVVQDDVFNRSRLTTVIVCATTSNLSRANEPGNLLLDEGEGGLPKRSVVIVSQIASVEKASLGAKIGTLSAERDPRRPAFPAGLVRSRVSGSPIFSRLFAPRGLPIGA